MRKNSYKLNKLVAVAVAFGVVGFIFYASHTDTRPSDIKNKAKDITADYIETQKDLEAKGIGVKFNFDKTEKQITDSGILKEKEDSRNNLKLDGTNSKINGKDFDVVMKERIKNAHNLASHILETVNAEELNEGKELSGTAKSKIKADSKELIKAYNKDIMGVEFPEELSKTKNLLAVKGKHLENELNHVTKDISELDSTDYADINRILGGFVIACEEIGY